MTLCDNQARVAARIAGWLVPHLEALQIRAVRGGSGESVEGAVTMEDVEKAKNDWEWEERRRLRRVAGGSDPPADAVVRRREFLCVSYIKDTWDGWTARWDALRRDLKSARPWSVYALKSVFVSPVPAPDTMDSSFLLPPDVDSPPHPSPRLLRSASPTPSLSPPGSPHDQLSAHPLSTSTSAPWSLLEEDKAVVRRRPRVEQRQAEEG